MDIRLLAATRYRPARKTDYHRCKTNL